VPCRLIFLVGALSLTACATPPPQPCPAPEVIRITVDRPVPVPEWLTEPCSVDCPPIVTNGDLLICYFRQKQAIETCDSRLREIEQIK